ncbi:SAM-dependent methyltransferase [Chryseotalea sanaruensis]|uniref:SAM-dependent methyltransferase n=1 Tax=Chryseotalea sanaruensis TaxID=2482724 RepID=A0A401U857_9BACT|nr:class I SAM-dependent methyltransferase [Chryseotalea sanaruensis]GCC51066.1 SAM-dependent methyltransferase [Chryseotalea sanaruensis]
MINPNLLKEEVRSFIRQHERDDPRTIALLSNKVSGINSSELAAQIAGRQKAKNKIQTYYALDTIIYPPSLNLEQSSSETTARFKAAILKELGITKDKTIADLSGGFGIDTFFFSKVFKRVIHVEPNDGLQEIAQHNHKALGTDNILYVNKTAEAFLVAPEESFDVAYVDPSRRIENRKVFALTDCEPNIPSLQNKIFEHSKFLILKAAPLLDISAGIKGLPFVKKVIVISVDNECKELLFICEHVFVEEPIINAVNIQRKEYASFSFKQSQEQDIKLTYAEPAAYLYEPNASILKSGGFKSIAQSFGVAKLAVSTHLYTADVLVADFPGRIFKIDHITKPEPKLVHSLIHDKKANVITRNYPLSAEGLKKKLKLNDGGNHYVLAFSSSRQKYVTLCTRIQ